MSEDSPNQAVSSKDVFVSYASQDVSVANSMVEALERQGIKYGIHSAGELWLALG
jgi:hypothetical protein